MPEQSNTGLTSTLRMVRGFVFDVVEEAGDRVELLLATGQNAVNELVSKVFDYGKGIVLGVVTIAFDLADTIVVQLFSVITALIAVVIGAPELFEDDINEEDAKKEA